MTLPIFRSARRFVYCVVVVATILAFVPGGVRAASYGYNYPPYGGWTFSGTSTSGIGCGYNQVFVSPAAWVSNGQDVMDTGSVALGCGAYGINAWAGFTGNTFTVGITQTYVITYKWQISWSASVGTALCFFGSDWAEAWIKFYGNLYDETAQAWKLNGDLPVQVWYGYGSCGVGGYGSQSNAIYYVQFSAPLVKGNTYHFYTYLLTHTLADAVGAVNANARANVGSNGATAYLLYMSVL